MSNQSLSRFDLAGKVALITGASAGRMGHFEELDGALLLLTSEAGSFINGTSIVVDGGHLVKPI